MLFHVYEEYTEQPNTPAGEFSLVCTNWDDFGYRTEYRLIYHRWQVDVRIGYVKIACRGQQPGADGSLPKCFSQLPAHFFSLGQGEEYYAQLNKLEPAMRNEILKSLRDVAWDLDHFDDCRMENAMEDSLLRAVTEFSVRHQLHRMATGGVRLCEYSFAYTVPCNPKHPQLDTNRLEFKVIPESSPPSNVHVLIGRNGTGKTSTIKDMIRSIRGSADARGKFEYTASTDRNTFANVLCVAFSPFDDFSELDQVESRLPYSYVGLNKTSGNLAESIEDQFFESFSRCMISGQKRSLWMNAIGILKDGDAAFAEANIDQLAGESVFGIASRSAVSGYFGQLSSGHKVVLLTVTSCVDRIEERSILFLDEPENHLHPPLLAALVRALSDLLIKRNGVAIISTHSPVVLQEVPGSCVWKLYRYNQHLVAARPTIQTFGETIGALTNDVFGLESSLSGYHKLLEENVKQLADYDRICELYEGQLGTVAERILRNLLDAQRRGEKI